MSQQPPTSSAPDPIGWASARLFGAGVERTQRLATLRFLGILLETADDEGHVRCDPDDLAGLGLLHGMDAEEVTRSRTLLETFGVLDRVPTGWLIKHYGPVGDEVPPAEALAAIGRVLARPAGTAAAATGTAAVGPQSTNVVPMEPARERLARRWMAAPVGAAAAAAVVILALVVSGQVHVPLVSRPASNSRQNAEGVANTPSSAGPGVGAASTAPPASSSPSSSAAGSATTASGTPPSSSGPSAVGAPPAPALCPVGNVSATVDHMSQQLDSAAPASSIAVSLPPIVHTSVSGEVRNTSADAVVVNPFPVTVNFTDPAGRVSRTVTTTALAGPAPIGPGATIPWSVTVDNPRDAPLPGTANAGPPAWRWQDATLSSLCPH
ncbi:MAG: hypothetical protein JO265_01770 [Acidimicrobiia bacterium]|nr:hypothetical protein [Acidimicrobiia bacterium]